MKVREHVPLASLTTFRIGGPARAHIVVEREEELKEAFAYAKASALLVYPLGQGSNVLASDEPIEKVVLSIGMNGISHTETSNGVELVADAGVGWDKLVTYACERGWWGIENLAGIPGTVGAAPVQNIGAYGADISQTLSWLDAYDPATGHTTRMNNTDCHFSYRDSYFKEYAREHDQGMVIIRVAFLLSKTPKPMLAYPDLQQRIAFGDALNTPTAIANAVRSIRSTKFPDLRERETAGSFFKNPVISQDHYDELKQRFPDMPGFASETGIKVPLAWILDHVLKLKGYRMGNVGLFERQPLVLVADRNAHARDVDALATFITSRVFEETKIKIEREVQTLA